MNKLEIRKNILKKRNNITNNLLNFYSFSIINKIIRKFNLINTKIGIYFPINNEINSLFIFNIKNNNIFIPKIENNKMNFYAIKSNSKINVSNFLKNKNNFKITDDLIFKDKVFQPKLKKNKIMPEIIIVPVVAFNDNCFRIGYGGGFYDRYLINKKILKIGVAMEFQKKEFHVEHYDIALDYIFTERRIYMKLCKKLS